MERKILSLADRISIVRHGDLISFLDSNSFSILHTEVSPERLEMIDKIKKGRITPSPFFSYLKHQGFLGKGKINIQERISSEFNHPIILHSLLILTNRCNMDCRYCYTEANEHLNEEEIIGDDWLRIFENVKIPNSGRLQNISFTGGEPTQHPDFVQILCGLSGKYKIEVSTNSLKLNEKILTSLEKFDGLMGVNVSIDSCNPLEDEIMRGGGTYEPRIKNLKKLLERDIPTCVGIVVNGITTHSLEDTTRKLLDGFPSLRIRYIPISKMGRARGLNKSIFLTEQDIERYISSVARMIKEYGDKILTDPTSSADNGEDMGFHWSGRCSHMKYESKKNLYKIGDPQNRILKSERCNAAYGVVSVSPSGRLRPCLRADSFYGRLAEGEIKEVLMPSLVGLTFEEIGRLHFWDQVEKRADGFNPAKICALKYNLGGKNGSK